MEMLWILQNNLMAEAAHTSLVEQLERQDIPYYVVSLIPFARRIDPDYDVLGGKVLVIGSTAMKYVAREKGWSPGYIDENLDYKNVLLYYRDQALNDDGQVWKFKDLKIETAKMLFGGEHVFIRPVLDDKSFTGHVIEWSELGSWQEKVLRNAEISTFSTLTGEDEIVLSSPKEIFKEYRFLVVDGEVITGSLYKRGQTVHHSPEVDDAGIFAQEMADRWYPNRAFVLDVALTPTGYKVLELNSVNSAGFYAMDMGKYVAALNQLSMR